jgi:CoA-transferase family III
VRFELEEELIAEAWTALTDDRVERGVVDIDGHTRALPSRFAVSETAVASVTSALAAAGALHRQHTARMPRMRLDRRHVAAAVRSERYFRVGDRAAGMGFATLSRLWHASDGWIRTHANYSWHRDALLRVLETTADVDSVACAIAERSTEELEASVFAAGGIAGAVRPIAQWQAHPQGAAVHAEPLIAHHLHPEGAPRHRVGGAGPMSGVRVLDLTRVIAGPVCTRYLGTLGADVLRLDPPHRPDMAAGEVGDTLLGKRSATVDLRSPDGVDALHGLLETADVLVCGYRPGALERFGLAEDELIARHPGLVVVVLDAWGHTGPWAGRRGFDSVVQGPTGIAHDETVDGVQPGALPCQLLDHGTGYLAAAAALDGVRRQEQEGGTHVRRLSLARTAAWLTARPSVERPETAADDDVTPWLQVIDHAEHLVSAVRPPGELDDRPLVWPARSTTYGSDAPVWHSR